MRLRRSLLNTRYSMKSNKYFSSNGISNFFNNSKEEGRLFSQPLLFSKNDFPRWCLRILVAKEKFCKFSTEPHPRQGSKREKHRLENSEIVKLDIDV
jgi:hypothetical protein